MSARNKPWFWLAVFLLAFPLTSATAWSDSAGLNELIAKARSLEGRGRLDLASRTWDQILLVDPNNAQALAGLARYAKQNGNTKDATVYLDRLRAVDPSNPEIERISGMGSPAAQKNQLEQAQRLAAKHDFIGAMTIYQRVFGDDPPPGEWAIVYYETQSATPAGWDSATAGLNGFVQKYPNAEAYRLSLGKLYTYRERTRLQGLVLLESIKSDPALVEKARQAWRQALLWYAGNPESLPSLRAYLMRYPDPDLAKLNKNEPVKAGVPANSRSSANSGPSSAIPLQMASPRPPAGPVAQGNPPPSPPGSDVELTPAPKKLRQSAEEGLGYKALQQGKLTEADKHFSAALKATPDSATALAGLGFLRMKQEDFSAAVSLFEKANAREPGNSTISDALTTAAFWNHMKTGSDLLKKNEGKQAAAEFKQAVALRPQNTDAMRALAGTYLQIHQPSLALPLYQKLQHVAPQSSDVWYGLVKSAADLGRPSDALNYLAQTPEDITNEWMSNPEWMVAIANVYADAGQLTKAQKYLGTAQQAVDKQDLEQAAKVRLQIAGVYWRLQNPTRAAEIYSRVTSDQPFNLDAWEGLLGSLLAVPDDNRALSTFSKIPPDTYQSGMSRASFIRALARVKAASGQYSEAEDLLQKAIAVDRTNGEEASVESELQLADVWSHVGKTRYAEQLLRRAANEHPESADAWLALISLLHSENKDAAAVSEMQQIPESTAAALRENSAFQSVQAAIYSSQGRNQDAIAILRRSMEQTRSKGQNVPIDSQIQLAWLLLDANAGQGELYSILETLSANSGLTAEQRAGVNTIWSTWSLRRAATAAERSDFPQAIAILQAATRLLPNDPKLRGALAGVLLQSGDTQGAYTTYRNWGLREGTADDFSGGIGSAMSVRDDKTADRWLERGLQQYPNSPGLLSLAGKRAAARGDYKKAELYFREALAMMNPKPTANNIPAGRRNTSSLTQTLGSLLLKDQSGPDIRAEYGNSPPVSKPERMPTATPGAMEMLKPLGTAGPPISELKPARYVTPEMQQPNENYPGTERPPIPSQTYQPEPLEANTLVSSSSSADQSNLHDDIAQALAAITGRNSPYVSEGMTIRGRSGQSGLDRLLVEQANLEASTTVGDDVRLSLLVRPTFLNSGTPDATTTLGFGTTPTPSASTSPTASGASFDGQLAARDFGMRLGVTPIGFPIVNWVGGLRINPGAGHFTILVDRDSIRDSKLSWAGEHDPATNRLWGGVVGNYFSLQGNWARANSGLYANVGYQYIQGKDVESNNRFDASTGAYFKLLSRSEGSLTVGLNLGGMHYDQNLRYFTLGQGGYFSPQQYFLANVPVQWIGVWHRRLQYSVSGSLGVQYFHENQSPYFPTSTALQEESGMFYPARAATGGNYNVDSRLVYQITPQWLLGVFASANNAREYRNAMGGLYLQYLFRPRPFTPDVNVQSIPDWRGLQPFGLAAPDR